MSAAKTGTRSAAGEQHATDGKYRRPRPDGAERQIGHRAVRDEEERYPAHAAQESDYPDDQRARGRGIGICWDYPAPKRTSAITGARNKRSRMGFRLLRRWSASPWVLRSSQVSPSRSLLSRAGDLLDPGARPGEPPRIEIVKDPAHPGVAYSASFMGLMYSNCSRNSRVSESACSSSRRSSRSRSPRSAAARRDSAARARSGSSR